MNGNVNWLVTCPCSDGNFKCRIATASIEEIEETVKELDRRFGNEGQKVKRKVLMARLKRLKNEKQEIHN